MSWRPSFGSSHFCSFGQNSRIFIGVFSSAPAMWIPAVTPSCGLCFSNSSMGVKILLCVFPRSRGLLELRATMVLRKAIDPISFLVSFLFLLWFWIWDW